MEPQRQNGGHRQTAPLAAPGFIHIVESLPTTGTQKIQKHSVYPQGVDPRRVAGVLDFRALKRRRRD